MYPNLQPMKWIDFTGGHCCLTLKSKGLKDKVSKQINFMFILIIGGEKSS